MAGCVQDFGATMTLSIGPDISRLQATVIARDKRISLLERRLRVMGTLLALVSAALVAFVVQWMRGGCW